MSPSRLRTRLGGHLAYPGLLLGTAALLATSLLTLGHLSTEAAIAQRQAEDLTDSLAQVIPARLHNNDLLSSQLDIPTARGSQAVFRAMQQQAVTAVAYSRVTTEGYGGPIKLMMGVAANGQLLGVRVLSHKETPGLGDKMEVAKSDWIRAFEGLSLVNPPLDQWAVKKDGGQFDQFTGATITPRALVKTVRDGLIYFDQHRLALLNADAAPLPPATAPDTITTDESANNARTDNPVGGAP